MDHEETRELWPKPRRLEIRGVMLTLCLAFGIFAVSGGASRFFFHTASGKTTDTSNTRLGGTLTQPQLALETTEHSTALCAGDTDLPVLEGVDLVSYFSLEDGAAAMYGFPEYKTEFNGYHFLFVSEENKAKFEEEPWKYIPGWGGFCAWGIAQESWWTKGTLGPDADPNSWLITPDGILLFFRSEHPKHQFMHDLEANIAKGNEVWYYWFQGEPPGAGSLGSPLNTACFCSRSTCQDA